MTDVKVDYPHRERLIAALHKAADDVLGSGMLQANDAADLVKAANDFREAELSFAHGVRAARGQVDPGALTLPKTNTTIVRAA